MPNSSSLNSLWLLLLLQDFDRKTGTTSLERPTSFISTSTPFIRLTIFACNPRALLYNGTGSSAIAAAVAAGTFLGDINPKLRNNAPRGALLPYGGKLWRQQQQARALGVFNRKKQRQRVLHRSMVIVIIIVETIVVALQQLCSSNQGAFPKNRTKNQSRKNRQQSR
jgi:hypothetical protein